eukprot:scaffold6198_cov107-Isochrysis_galbana.AAC.2
MSYSGCGRPSSMSSGSSPTSAESQMADGSGFGLAALDAAARAAGGPIMPGVGPLYRTGASQPYDGLGTGAAASPAWSSMLPSAAQSAAVPPPPCNIGALVKLGISCFRRSVPAASRAGGVGRRPLHPFRATPTKLRFRPGLRPPACPFRAAASMCHLRPAAVTGGGSATHVS